MRDDLRTDIYLRPHTESVKEAQRGQAHTLSHPTRIADRLLVIAAEHEDRGSFPEGWAAFRVVSRQQDGTYALATPLLPAEAVRGFIRGRVPLIEWKATHRYAILDTQEFLHTTFFREAYQAGATVAAMNLPEVLSSLATWWGRGKKSNSETWVLRFCPVRVSKQTRRGVRSHHPTVHPDCPGIHILPAHPPMAFISWIQPWRGGRWGVPHHRGRWLSIREKAYALTGTDHSLESALPAFGVMALPNVPAAESIKERLDVLWARLDATCDLAVAVLQELGRHPVLREHETVGRKNLLSPHSSAGLLRTYMNACRVTGPPPIVVAPGAAMTSAQVKGAAASAFHAPTSEVRERGTPITGVMLDVRSCFSASALLQDLSRWWSAARVRVEQRPREIVQTELEAATPEDYLAPTSWRNLLELYLIQPQGDIFPVTIPVHDRNKAEHEAILASVTVPDTVGPVWYTKADVLVSRFRTGKVPRILNAIRFRAEGTRRGLRRALFRGEIPLDPRDFVGSLVQIRHHLETKGLPHLASAAKVMANVACYGIAAQLERRPPREVMVHDGVRSYLARPDVYEEHGAHTCWPMATFTVSGSRLLCELLEQTTRAAGGEVAMMLTDCGLVTSSNGTPPEHIARNVIARMEGLNPFRTITPLVRPQDGTPEDPGVAWCYAIASPAYCRYRKRPGKNGIDIVKSNGFVLSMLLDPITHRMTRLGESAPAWWAQGWRFILGHARPGNSPTPPSWIDDPAVQVQSYRSPLQEPMVRRLHYRGGHPIRPFAVIYLRHWYTEAEERRQEMTLELSPTRPGREYATYRHYLVLHPERPERKMANGWDRGRLRRYAITATGIQHIGRETPFMLGQENPTGGAMQMGSPQIYAEAVTADAFHAARRLLLKYSKHLVANLLGISRHRLRDTLLTKRAPRQDRRTRFVALARTITANNGQLPMEFDPQLKTKERMNTWT